MNVRKMTSLGVVMVQEWPDASGEDDHGREGGGSRASKIQAGREKAQKIRAADAEAKNYAAGLKSQTDAEDKHGIKQGDTVMVGGERHTVLAVSGNSLKTSPEKGSTIHNVHASKANKLYKVPNGKGGFKHVTIPNKESAPMDFKNLVIESKEQLAEAVAQISEAQDSAAAQKAIKARAFELKATDLIPDSWESWQTLDGEILSEASFAQSDSHDGTASKLHDAIHGSVLAGKDMDLDGDDDSADAKNYGPMHSVRAVHDKHVVYSMGGKNFAHKYSKDDEGDVHLAGGPVEVEPSYQTKKGPVSESCSESCAFVAEAGFDSKSGELPITIIRPGISKNNRYYSPEMLKRDCKIFEGSKMFVNHATDKEASQRPEGDIRDWVASVKDVHAESDGTVKGTAVVFDPAFKQKIAALAETGLLKTMGVSIRAAASVSEGKMEGKSVKVIEGFKQARSVDFVTFAGAGGQPD